MFWWFNPFTWLIFFCVIGVAVYLIIKYELVVTSKGVRKRFETETKESALEILEKRLARGEITGEEFEMIKKKLEET
ncbi:MAG: SHOCT domain-containing protein [Candidatus Jettenia sp.]|uniref:SHOCT domain-containing protein n=1 Tax=Candidatus Jettenia caeni TaxID=247490 RepID=I3IH03_9BACT|nr:SHOCT domain-containing protein [Candidatus Jettenia sp. AMX1]MBC6929052.1 SHOCT domain-containing protein [Candidatus Jettenia sp.]WKZ16328.1 MAG: SHOCT domain-containing protein [Candidatus Jettenia caeni]KAA0249327.1 MAG: SHOCT domain-containing protein [Candidatus Jettenia sp. AMX1]MCE7881484.1 SHOCT domain-containing protein [Candidatus Jettenia sp. AMX1]MCQ3928029.1 SHOCT domain-containing protein [Candidatus Jettenia sp.]